MWSTVRNLKDIEKPEQALRESLQRAVGVCIREWHSWLAGMAGSPETWDELPEWTKRAPAELDQVYMALMATPSPGLLSAITVTVGRLNRVSRDSGRAPSVSLVASALDAYTSRSHDD